ncbi:unnamed protein product [Linum tenue]|uniref:Uncharacterized protein n=1 Tax=Linum tenue TaxID=586396 RepID=A0AAV0IWP0_9ROSI|nr:unnamed protein product [Linum tenue]
MNPQLAALVNNTIWYVPRKKNIFSQPDDVLTAAERYIEEHGTEAFERMIVNKTQRNERSRSSTENKYMVNNSYTSSNYMIFDDDYRY